MRLLVALATLSLAVILAGFIYDIYFAGIPYQEPTAEVQSRWNFHKDVARTIMLAGAIGFALMVLGALVMAVRRQLHR